MFWFHRLSLGLLLLHLAAAYVFLNNQAAHEVLSRQRRANSFWEEIKQGNMERECMEERCDQEEAREIFEDKEKTHEFWVKYVDGDSCESMPCAHRGVCKDTEHSYTCFCQEGYQGVNCEIVIPELCETNNGGCKHFCNINQGKVQCSCADGYFLASDEKSCDSDEKFKCGAVISSNKRNAMNYVRRNTTVDDTTQLNSTVLAQNYTIHIPITADDTRIVNGVNCLLGECPWQAVLVSKENISFCGGTILNKYIILTAAHCMNQTSSSFYVKLGDFDTLVDEGNEVIHEVETIVTHIKYRPDTFHNDIALIKLTKPIQYTPFILPACIPEQNFAEKVLMRQPNGMISGFGRLGEHRQPATILQRLNVPYVDRQTCIESTQLHISARMFCAGYHSMAYDACQGDSGGPHVTPYSNTYFITGIVSWGEGCARKGKYGIYTQVSKFLTWIRGGMARLALRKSSSRLKRQLGSIRRLSL